MALINKFPEYQGIVDQIMQEIDCNRLKAIEKGSRLSKPRAYVCEGVIVMPRGMEKNKFASVFVEEVCHICVAPGPNKERIIGALQASLKCNRRVAYAASNYAADLVCEFYIMRRPSLDKLRQPKVHELLSRLDDSPTIREVQAIIAELRGLCFPCRSKSFKEVRETLEIVNDPTEQCIKIGILLYPILRDELDRR